MVADLLACKSYCHVTVCQKLIGIEKLCRRRRSLPDLAYSTQRCGGNVKGGICVESEKDV